MSDKLSIVYVGKKAKKKDTITGSRLLFIQGEPMSVDLDVARRLLEYPKVWVEADKAKEVIKKNEASEAEQLLEAERLAEEAAKNELKESFLTKDSSGETLDLAKYTGPQLETLVEAEDLSIAVKPKPVAGYREAVREAMREKNGTPELTEEQE